MVPGSLENVLDDGALLGATVGEPASEGEDRHLETSRSKVTELHVLGVIGSSNGGLRHDGSVVTRNTAVKISLRYCSECLGELEERRCP